MFQADEVKTKTSPLSLLKSGESATIVSLDKTTSLERNKLMALGMMPGVRVKLLQRYPSYIILVGYTQLALDRETAALIDVTR